MVKKIKFFKIVSIINLVLSIIIAGAYFFMSDKTSNFYWMISGLTVIISNLITYFFARWSIKTEVVDENDKKCIGFVYVCFILINLIPALNFFLLFIQIILWLIDYITLLNKNNKIDYNF